MIQRSYLIWYKHKSYFHTHWQLFLLQIHPSNIVWYILQMALFLFCQIISDTETLLKLRDQNSRFQNLCILLKFFKKLVITTLKWNFFKFLTFFQSVLVFSYLLIQQRKYSLNWRSFTKPYPCNIDSFKTTGLWPRPVTFESKMRPSRPRLRLTKMVSRPSLKTSSLQIIQQSC